MQTSKQPAKKSAVVPNNTPIHVVPKTLLTPKKRSEGEGSSTPTVKEQAHVPNEGKKKKKKNKNKNKYKDGLPVVGGP